MCNTIETTRHGCLGYNGPDEHTIALKDWHLVKSSLILVNRIRFQVQSSVPKTRRQQQKQIGLLYRDTKLHHNRYHSPCVNHDVLCRFASRPSAAAALEFTPGLAGRSARAGRGPFAPLPSPGGGRFIVGWRKDPLLPRGLPGPPGAPMRRV